MKPKKTQSKANLAAAIAISVAFSPALLHAEYEFFDFLGPDIASTGAAANWTRVDNWDPQPPALGFPDLPNAVARFGELAAPGDATAEPEPIPGQERANILFSSSLLNETGVLELAAIQILPTLESTSELFRIRNYSSGTAGVLKLHGWDTEINGTLETLLVGNFGSSQQVRLEPANAGMQIELHTSGVVHNEGPGVLRLTSEVIEAGGPQGITKTGPGILWFDQFSASQSSANSTYTGGFVLREGIVQYSFSGGRFNSAFGNGDEGSALTLQGGNLRSSTSSGRSLNVDITLDGDSILGSDDPDFNGNIAFNSQSGRRSTTIASDSTVTVYNTITWHHGTSGPGGLTKDGPGLINFTGLNEQAVLTHSGPTVVNDGTMWLQSELTQSSLRIGTVATLTGAMTLNNGLVMEAGSTLALTLREEVSDGVIVTAGAIDLGEGDGDVILQLDLTTIPDSGDVFVLIDNQGTDPLTGTLSYLGDTLTEGQVITLNGLEFEFTYQFGGSSVALTAVSDVVPTENPFLLVDAFAGENFSLTDPDNFTKWDPDLSEAEYSLGTANTFTISTPVGGDPVDDGEGGFRFGLDASVRAAQLILDDPDGLFPETVDFNANNSGSTARELWFELPDTTAITLSENITGTVRFGADRGTYGNLGIRLPSSGTTTFHVGNENATLDFSGLLNGTSLNNIGRGGLHAGSTILASDRAQIRKTGPGTLDLRVEDNQGNRVRGTIIEGGTVLIAKTSDIGWNPAVEMEDHVVINGGTLVFDGLTSNLGSNRGFMIGDGGATLEAINEPLAIVGVIQDIPGQSGAIIKTGDTPLRFGAFNAYTGGTIIREGVARYSTPDSFGFGPVVIEEGATISAFSGGVVLNSQLIIDGDSVNFGGDNFVMYFGGNVDLGGETRTLNFLNSAVFSGDIENGGLIMQTVTNGQRVEFNEFNSYDGDTTVNRGNLMVNLSTSSNVTVTRGEIDPEAIGSIGGIGEINGNVTVDGAIKPGPLPSNSLGTFFIFGDLEMSGAAEAIFEIGNIIENDIVVQTGADALQVSGDATIDGTVRVALIGGFEPDIDDEFQLINVTGGTLTVAPGVSFVLDSPGEGKAWDTSQFATTGAVSVVEAVAPTDDYDIWAAAFGLASEDSARDADPDGDGFTNFQEFAFGSDPTQPSGSLVTSERDGGELIVTFLRRDSGVSYEVQTSTTLTPPWSEATGISHLDPVDQTGVPAGYTRVSFSVPVDGIGFFRIEATEIAP